VNSFVMGSSVQEKKMHYPVMTEKHVADRWQVSLKTLLGIKRDFKPEVPEAAQGLDAKAEDNYFTAKEIAQAASQPIHLFRDQAERNRKRVPHLMLVGNLRFSLPAILEWEMANRGCWCCIAVSWFGLD